MSPEENKKENEKKQTYQGELRQVGCIVFGGGINEKHWMQEARKAGFDVRPKTGHAELWKKTKKK